MQDAVCRHVTSDWVLCMLQPTVIEDLIVGGTAGAAAAAATTPLDVVKTV